MSPPATLPWDSIRLFAMDVDGVLTDGTVRISSDGAETKVFSILDGLGLKRLAATPLQLAWISGRASGATLVRAKELHITHVIQGRTDKITALRELASQLGIPARQCIYMGDDDIDAPAMAWAGIGVSVPDAMPAALAAADYITVRRGGHGAVREICEYLQAAQPALATPTPPP